MRILCWCPHVNPGGGIRLLSQLLPALARHPEVELIRLAVLRGWDDLESLKLDNVSKIEFGELSQSAGAGVLHQWLRSNGRVLGLKGTGRAKNFLLRSIYGDPAAETLAQKQQQFHALAHDCDLVYAFWPHLQPFFEPQRPLVCTYQDTTLIDFPEILGMRGRDAEYANSRKWLVGSARIVVSSEATKANLVRLFGARYESAAVIPHAILPSSVRAADNSLRSSLADKLPSRYIVFPSNITPHKNHYTLLVAWSRFALRKDSPLVLMGQGTDLLSGNIDVKNMLIDRVRGLIVRLGLEVSRDFHTLGYVDDSDVLPLIKGAAALVMSTLAEGGGSYPVEEALSVGTPVLCSDIPVMREHLAGRSAKIVWFDPESADSILKALETMTANYDEYKTSALKGMNDSRYTWDEIAAKYVEQFRKAIDGRAGGRAIISADEPVIREIESSHYEALSAFLVENNVPAVVRTFSPFPMNDETARRIALGSRRDRYYGAFVNDRIVGLSMLRGWDEGYTVPSFGVIVDHRFHHRGLGALLTESAIEEARRLGCERIRLSVFASNSAALHIYASKGFVEVQREPTVVADAPDERIVMSKELS
jgi:glycosyltransferase involved in cell wall biosynthesis/ribosomal protein S18 acetylase RimI-like enzyme